MLNTGNKYRDEWAVIQHVTLWTAVMTIRAYVHSVSRDFRCFFFLLKENNIYVLNLSMYLCICILNSCHLVFDVIVRVNKLFIFCPISDSGS
jgi:hypothetical protein